MIVGRGRWEVGGFYEYRAGCEEVKKGCCEQSVLTYGVKEDGSV